MKRLQLAWRHFACFRKHYWWPVLWLYVWISQIVYAGSYWSGADVKAVTSMSGFALPILLLTVFISGNLYSVQNNAFLKTRPLPPSTCFLTDCVLPFCLYMIIPLLQEIPVVIWWNFGMTDLFWAWLDTLVIHGLAFAAAWLLGALIPRLSSPLKWAGIMLGIFVALWLSSAMTGQVGETVDKLDDFSGQRFSNMKWYFTNAGILLLVGLLCLVALKSRFSDRARVLFLYFVVVPFTVFCFQRGPESVSEAILYMDLHRRCLNAREAGYDLQYSSYRQNRDSSHVNGEPVIRWNFNIIDEKARGKTVKIKEILKATVHGASQTRDLEIKKQRWSRKSHIAMHALLYGYYGQGEPVAERAGHSYGKTIENNQQIKFAPKKLDGLRDQLLRVDYDLLVRERELVPLMTSARAGKKYTSQRAGRLKVTGTRRKLRRDRSQGHNRNNVRTYADATFRQENLMWKRLIIGKPPSRMLAVVFRERDGSGLEVALANEEAWAYRYGGAFPKNHENIGNSFRYKVTASGESKEADGDSGRRNDLVVDIFEMRPVRKVRAKVAAVTRFGIEEDDNPMYGKELREFVRNNPLKLLRRISKGNVPEEMEEGGWRSLMQGLGRYPEKRYKELVFDAARYRPTLASFIVNNGWEYEAMDVWLELIRQKRRLPPSVLRTFFLMGDERLMKALVEYQRYHPTPNVMACAGLKQEWKEPLRRATEHGVDFWYRRIAPYEERDYWLRRYFPMVAPSGEWIEHRGVMNIREEIRSSWSSDINRFKRYYHMPEIPEEKRK